MFSVLLLYCTTLATMQNKALGCIHTYLLFSFFVFSDITIGNQFTLLLFVFDLRTLFCLLVCNTAVAYCYIRNTCENVSIKKFLITKNHVQKCLGSLSPNNQKEVVRSNDASQASGSRPSHATYEVLFGISPICL